jgi:hypothetical protein
LRRIYKHVLSAVAASLAFWSFSAEAQNLFKSGQDLPPGAGETTIGNSSVVVRTVTGTVEEGKRYLSLMDDIYRNELVETYNESATEITFLDETTMSLGPDTSVVLDRFIYDPDKTANEFVVTITEGVLRFATGNMQSESYKVHTPVATIGVRGTVIEVAVEKPTDGMGAASVELTVLEGEASFTRCNGQRVVVLQGSSATAFGPGQGCP